MNISDLLITMAQVSEVEQPTLFPFPFRIHLVFCIIAVVFFVFRFIKKKLPYQIIMAVAIPASLMIWISNSRSLFYGVGIAEAVLLLCAFVSTFIFKPTKTAENNVQEKNDEKEQTE
ncbi:MAG: hypothetical protein K2J08_07030 [Ruminococcus sp.]|nr:hypothetical protein [Ruminococcus sp.]